LTNWASQNSAPHKIQPLTGVKQIAAKSRVADFLLAEAQALKFV
jgi:hypothetical protein